MSGTKLDPHLRSSVINLCGWPAPCPGAQAGFPSLLTRCHRASHVTASLGSQPQLCQAPSLALLHLINICNDPLSLTAEAIRLRQDLTLLSSIRSRARACHLLSEGSHPPGKAASTLAHPTLMSHRLLQKHPDEWDGRPHHGREEKLLF